MAKDDPTLTTMRFIPKHETVQKKYVPKLLILQTIKAMNDSDAYKLTMIFANCKGDSKTKASTKAIYPKEKTDQKPLKQTYDEVNQGDNVEEEKLDEEKTNKEEKVNEMYNDVNVNLGGRDTKMTDTLLANQSSSVSSGFISKMLYPNLDTGIDSILNLNIESTSLVDVPVTTNDEIPPSSVTTIPPPPIPLIQPLQQTLVSTPTIVPSTSLQNLPTFGSLFKFEDRVKSLEDDFSEFKQTNLFAEAVSLIPDIIDKYLANQMNEAVKAAVQLQSDRLREEAHAKNEDFINKIDENIKKIIKEQVKKSHAVAANLSELELKKILIDKMENNKSIDILVQQKTLDKTSKSTSSSKEGSKSKTRSTNKSASKEQVHTVNDLEEPAHQEFETSFTDDHHVDETTQFPDHARLLIQGITINLNIEERLALGVSLRMFTRSIVIKRGFIYQNQDKKNRLRRIDELHKFSDGILNDVRSALDDTMKRIRMKYLPQTLCERDNRKEH
ncbi:hypothetical protein Tco_0646192 [Tanacetum coccineum]